MGVPRCHDGCTPNDAMSREDAAFVAGILEGEGYLQRQPRKRIVVTNTDRALLVRVRLITGIGHISNRRVRTARTKADYYWNITRSAHVDWLLARCAEWLMRWQPI